MENDNQDNNEIAADAQAAAESAEKPTESIIGKIVSGDVINVTHFGAFVKLESGEEGLVHISEVANKYVTDINEHVAVGNKVQVKVLSRNAKNQLELSIKRAEKKEEGPVMFLHKKSKNSDFEDKMSSFLKRSEEKQIDLRRNLKNKQGVAKKRR